MTLSSAALLAVLLLSVAGISLGGESPVPPDLPPPIYMQFNYSSSAAPLCIECPNNTKNAERFLCSSNPDFTWDTLRQFEDPIPAGNALYKIKFDIWGRFLCAGNETHLLLMIMTDFFVDQTFTAHNATAGCTCGNCVFKYTEEIRVVNSNYVYGGRNTLQPYVPAGSLCLSEIEIYMYYVPIKQPVAAPSLPVPTPVASPAVLNADNLPFILWLSVAGGVLVLVVVLLVVKFCRKRDPGKGSGSLQGQLSERQNLLTKAGEPDYFDKEIDIKQIKMGQRIGKGSFGEVYLGVWQGTAVAVKKLPAHKVTDEFLREFAREAKIMKSLRHPNVIQFLGACTDPPDICIITEYMNLGSLYNLIHDKTVQLSWSRVRRIAVDAAKGMAYLHYRNPAIIHRDLKSHNLLVDENWKVKVCDFGLSRIYGDTQGNAMTACGTPCWTAPEILRNSHYTTKADVYSFGIVLWELVTREEPFAGMPPFQVIFAVGTKGARPDLPTYCPPELTKLIAMCWSEDPALRPTFNEILEYLELCDFGESTPTSVASSLSQSLGASLPLSLPDKIM